MPRIFVISFCIPSDFFLISHPSQAITLLFYLLRELSTIMAAGGGGAWECSVMVKGGRGEVEEEGRKGKGRRGGG